MGLPDWEGHRRSAGQISGGLGPRPRQFLPGVGESWHPETCQDFAKLFQQSWRLWFMNWASGKLKQLHLIAKEGLGSALPRSLLELS